MVWLPLHWHLISGGDSLPHESGTVAGSHKSEVLLQKAKLSTGGRRLGLPGRSPCPQKAKRKEKWGSVVKEDMHIIKAGSPSVAKGCQRWGDAMVYELNFLKATSVDGYAYELPLPDYIVADEPDLSWRERRSTLQLLAALDIKGSTLQPMGPAHCRHDLIARVGDGAFSHWREPLPAGTSGRSKLRFATPGNVPLEQLSKLLAVVYPMAPPMGLVEFVHKPNKKAKDYDPTKRRRRKEIHRELYFQTFPTVGVEPHLVDRPEDTQSGVWYLWRASHHDEFDIDLKPGELYQKRMPLAFSDYFGSFEKQGATLFPPPQSYRYYENKVTLTRLFQQARVRMPPTWVFTSEAEALKRRTEVKLPVVIKDPYGYSSMRLLQAADQGEFGVAMSEFFSNAQPGVEALVQNKVVALREARITYVDGRPFHGYWRIRQSLTSASAASTRGGYQDFNFPLAEIAPFVEKFANKTGVPVGGVDLIWQEANPDVRSEPYTLEVSPTSDINPPTPSDWKESYADFKHTKGFRTAYIDVRRKWTDAMAVAVIDRYRRSRQHLFIGLDAVLTGRAPTLPARGRAAEAMRDELRPGAREALFELRRKFFIRLLAVRGAGFEDPFNATQSWLYSVDVDYDDLTVLQKPEHRTFHLSRDSLLLDALDAEAEKQLQEMELPFVNFAGVDVSSGSWDEVVDRIDKETRKHVA